VQVFGFRLAACRDTCNVVRRLPSQRHWESEGHTTTVPELSPLVASHVRLAGWLLHPAALSCKAPFDLILATSFILFPKFSDYLLTLHICVQYNRYYNPFYSVIRSLHSAFRDLYLETVTLWIPVHAVAQTTEELRYTPEGRGFDSRWCYPSCCTVALGATEVLTEMSIGNISWRVKVADVWSWPLYHLHVPIFLKFGNLKLLVCCKSLIGF
jgi:hypothetical protein